MADTNRQIALTTTDNPFDPFEDFDRWFEFDVKQGYNTCSYLSRVSHLNRKMSSQEEFYELERAIDEICELNILGIYQKVVKET